MDGSFDCDYVLVVSVEGKSPIELVVRSHMRILGGNRVFRYAPGDRVGVLYLEKYPKSVLPVEGSRGGGLAPVWLWGFCTATTFAIGLYMAVA